MDTCHHFLDIYPQEKMRDVSRPSYNSDPDFRPSTPPEFFTGAKPSKSRMSPIYPSAYRKLLELQIILPSLYFTCEQVIELMFLFPDVHYLRVQLICALFGHVLDLENIGNVVDLLNLDERDEVRVRCCCCYCCN